AAARSAPATARRRAAQRGRARQRMRNDVGRAMIPPKLRGHWPGWRGPARDVPPRPVASLYHITANYAAPPLGRGAASRHPLFSPALQESFIGSTRARAARVTEPN